MSEGVRDNIAGWQEGVERLHVGALYDELHRRYPDALTPTNYCALLLAAVIDHETMDDEQ